MSAKVPNIMVVGHPKLNTTSATEPVHLIRVAARRVPVAVGIALRATVRVADIGPVPVAAIVAVADIAPAADIAVVVDIAAVEDAAAGVVRTSASRKTSFRWRGSTT